MQDVLIPNGILADFFDYWEKLFIIYILDLWYNILECDLIDKYTQ